MGAAITPPLSSQFASIIFVPIMPFSKNTGALLSKKKKIIYDMLSTPP